MVALHVSHQDQGSQLNQWNDMAKYRITDSKTGKTIVVSGDSAPTEADAEQIFKDAGLRDTGSSKPSSNAVMDAIQGVGSFIAPKVTALGSGVANTAGMAKDFVDYNLATSNEDRNKEAQSYTDRMNRANDALKQFGFDSTKESGKQFDLKKFLKGTTAGAGELATLTTPIKGNIAARTITNALPGATTAIGDDKGAGEIVQSALLSSVLGTAGEKIPKIVGGTTRKAGEILEKKGEDLGIKRFGLTKLDKNKFKREFGETVGDFARKYGLIGEDVSGAQAVHDKLQDSFDDIARRSGIKVKTEDLIKGLADRAAEMADDELPTVQSKAAVVQKYAENLSKKFAGKDAVDIGDISNMRAKADKYAKFGESGEAADAYRTIRDLLQGTVRDAADKAGLKGADGKNLTDLGKSLNQLKTFLGKAELRDPEQGSKSPIGLIRAIMGGSGAATGAALGGPVGTLLGAAGGLAIDQITNSPKSMQNLSKALTKSGGALKKTDLPELIMTLLEKTGQIGGIKAGSSTIQ